MSHPTLAKNLSEICDALNDLEEVLAKHKFTSINDRMNMIGYLIAANAIGFAGNHSGMSAEAIIDELTTAARDFFIPQLRQITDLSITATIPTH